MNVQKIFEALEEDSQNSAIGIICGELEGQGYAVKINGVPVTAADFYDGKHPEMEKKLGDLEFSLFVKSSLEQKFTIEFIEFHEIVIKK